MGLLKAVPAVIGLMSVLLSPAGASAPLLIAAEGSSAYTIVLSTDALPAESRAAAELQYFLREMTGATLPVERGESAIPERAIVLGDGPHLRAVAPELALDGLGEEGFVIQTLGERLIIAGPGKRGTMYGVYTFLEEYLGCRFFAPEVTHIPKRPRLEIGALNIRHTPVMEYREVYYAASKDLDWCTRNRLNGHLTELGEEHGGKVAYHPFGHSFWTLIPPEEYFETHPEWFSLVDGERTLTGRFTRTQLCLTNEALIEEAIRRTRQWIEENPDATIISISQNDGPGGWCECENCAAMEAAQGGAHSAPVIHFVNRIAEALGGDYPNHVFDTFAYSYTTGAPRDLKPLPNVVVRLCTSGCKSHAFDDPKCATNEGIRGAVRDWFRLTDRIYIWDYTINFRQYLLPFPNLHTVGPNVRFFVNHGVRGMFAQGSGDVSHSDMGPLRSYLLAKLLWNPDYDRETAINEFLAAYFGPAAEPMRAYVDLLEAEVRGSDYHALHMSNFEPKIEAAYLGPKVLARATVLFEDAEARCADAPAFLGRVQQARLSIDYVKVSFAALVNAMLTDAEKQLPAGAFFPDALDRFFGAAERTGVEYMRESSRSNSSMEEFRQMLESSAWRREGGGTEIE
ncbi:MAG: DUF4838 domain-containing protein [Candidatus Hydrogenedentes bacterium]|nr:DUF4838 domain-containing protein [Candidatus Hydrogenedentota bacterium]